MKIDAAIRNSDLDSGTIAALYKGFNLDTVDRNVMKEGYKGQWQDAVNEANARKEANMGVTLTALELMGGGAYRVFADPIGTAKGVGQTVGDIATLPFGLATGVYNYATDGNFDMGTNAWGDSYGKGLSQTGDVLSAIPGLGAAGKLAKFTKAADLAGDIGKSVKSTFQNTYKINPWRFKADPEAYYHRSPDLENIVNRKTGNLQGFGNSKAGIEFSKDAGPGGTGDLVIRGDGSFSRINLKKPANSQLYFSKGVPLDGGRYNKVLDRKTGKLINGQGYQGPYMVEVKGVPMGASTKGRAPRADVTNIGGYAVSRRPISLDEAKFYKEHWLYGYKEVPKQLPGSPNVSISDKLKQFFDRPPGPMMLLGTSGGTNMVKKNIPYYEQLLNTYDSKVMSATNKKFYKDLIGTAKMQDGMVTEAQLRELDRLKTGNFDFGKKGYAKGGATKNFIELELPKNEIQDYINQGYIVEEVD